MKTLIWYGVTATIIFLAAATSGQNETFTASSSSSGYVQISKLVGRKVKSSQGEEIGVIKDVVLDRSNGCMAYTVLSTGGAETGITSGGGKIVAVPWAVYSPTSDLSVLIVNVDRDKIHNAPVFDYTRMDEFARPDYIDNVYSYYGVSLGGETGVAASSGATAGTDVTGTAGATATPGEVASPTAVGTALFNKRRSTRAHATPAASPSITEESSSESITSPSESKNRRRKAAEETSTRRPSATPQSPEGQE